MPRADIIDFRAERGKRQSKRVQKWLASLPEEEYEQTVKLMQATIDLIDDDKASSSEPT